MIFAFAAIPLTFFVLFVIVVAAQNMPVRPVPPPLPWIPFDETAPTVTYAEVANRLRPEVRSDIESGR